MNATDLTYVSVIEDDPVIQESLTMILESEPSLKLISIHDSVEGFLDEFISFSIAPSIILLDIQLRGITGLDGIPYIKQKLPETNIIILTTFEDREKIFKALCAGACSYLSKQSSVSDILRAILIVRNGGSYMSPEIARQVINHFAPSPVEESLSPRQQQIVQAIVDGKSYKLIASDLNISIDTVRTHIKKIYRTLEVNSKAELIKKANRRKF